MTRVKWANNLNDLARYIGSPHGTTQVIKNSYEISKALKEAADLLSKILQRKVQDYYDSYKPVEYQRTYQFLNSIRISPVKHDGDKLHIEVYFDKNMATHPSIFGGESGFVPILLNEGWTWNKKTGPYRLAFYEGFHFIEKAIEEFNKINRWGFVISKEVYYKGKKID